MSSNRKVIEGPYEDVLGETMEKMKLSNGKESPTPESVRVNMVLLLKSSLSASLS